MTANDLQTALSSVGMATLPAETLARFETYYHLLERWNARINLTAIRDADEFVRRQFLECIFCAQQLPEGVRTLLDFGSGGGFPGIPVALCRPEIKVTLAESQRKKAAFLREAVRALDLTRATVFDERVEKMDGPLRFDAVTLRAVDKMEIALPEAASRVAAGGSLVVFATTETDFPVVPGFEAAFQVAIPGSRSGILRQFSRQA